VQKGAYRKVEKLDFDLLEHISGGVAGQDPRYDLSLFIPKTVCLTDPRACLTLRKDPGGEIIPRAGWRNGDRILVHGQYTLGGWYFAYDKGSGNYGFVNPDNVV